MRRARTGLVLVTLLGPLLGGHEGSGVPDRDGDRIPDPHDPFPDDPDRPGKAVPDTVYAHSSSTLFIVDRRTGTPTVVAELGFADAVARQVTDIAIDRWGVMYAVAFASFHTCHPQTGRCETLAQLPASFNALTALAPEAPEGAGDALVGISTDGRWFRIGRRGESTELGHLGAGSSGDAYAHGVRVRAARDRRDGVDELVDLEPERPDSVHVAGVLEGARMYGFAACADEVVGFDEDGTVYRGTGASLRPIAQTGIAWWGAACSGPELVPSSVGVEDPARASGESTTRDAAGARPRAREAASLGCACEAPLR